jgi:metallo-beta-lactamase family protein
VELPVRAEVVGLPECLRARGRRGHPVWLRAAPVRPRVCYVVHGEPVALAALAARIDDELGCAVLPHQAERVLL